MPDTIKRVIAAIAAILSFSGVIRAEDVEGTKLTDRLSVESALVRESAEVAYLQVSILNAGQTPLELSGSDYRDLSRKLRVWRLASLGDEPISTILKQREIISTEDTPASFTLKPGETIQIRRDVLAKIRSDKADSGRHLLVWELPIESCKYPEIEVFQSALAGGEILKQERSIVFARGSIDLQR